MIFSIKAKCLKLSSETINDELQYVVNQPFNGSAQDIATFFHHYIDVKEAALFNMQQRCGRYRG